MTPDTCALTMNPKPMCVTPDTCTLTMNPKPMCRDMRRMGIAASSSVGAPPKLTADFFQYEGGQWNPVGNESAYTTSLPVDEVYKLWGWHFKGSDCMFYLRNCNLCYENPHMPQNFGNAGGHSIA